jgi:acetolactate synthase-1/2/3 large subunit
MRVCDYIAKRLFEHGIRNVYGLMGGGASGLNDGFIKNGQLNYICFHHEQGAGHAATGEAKLLNRLAVVNVTTGCGGTNSMTSVLDAWQDSTPVLFLSGNVRINQTSKYINERKNINLRKYGVQEHPITDSVQNMTKYSVMIQKVEDVAYELDKAIHIATSGRMGPVWVDIPANIQTAPMPERYETFNLGYSYELHPGKFEPIISLIKQSKRPLILAGYGVHLSGARQQFTEFIERHQIPFVSTFNSRDLLPGDHNLNIGCIGLKGCRAANFTIQNCDLLIVVGSCLNNTHVGYDEKLFSPMSKKIVIDIDINELKKETVNFDCVLQADLKDFFQVFPVFDYTTDTFWTSTTKRWKDKWPVYQPQYRDDSKGLDLYELVRAFNINMTSNDIIMTDAGSPSYVCPVGFDIKQNQRIILSPSQGDMGWAIPASVGVALNTDKNVVVFIGDGSFYSNMQELGVITYHKLPIKIVVANNNGYLSIRNTQTKFFEKRIYGVDNVSGLFFADLEKIANLFQMNYVKINNAKELDSHFGDAIHQEGGCIIEVMQKQSQEILPTISLLPNGKQGGLHQLYPFISDEEMEQEMLVKL